MDRLPSLNSIRIFETVARLLSYTAAAHELHVTTSAISHRIKALEHELGVALFNKNQQRIVLTPIGKQYFDQISQGLMQLSSATHALHRAKGARILRISASVTLTSEWLLPRIQGFMAANPDIYVELAANVDPVDFALGRFDVGINYLYNIPAGLQATPLGTNHIIPVCSPQLLAEPHPLRAPADLKHHTLIDARNVPNIEEPHALWHGWLKAARFPSLKGRKETYFSPNCVMLSAVERGMGVGLARTLAVSDALYEKRLVCPFGPAFALAANWYFYCLESTARNPEIAVLRDWLVAEAIKSTKSVKLPPLRKLH